MCKYRSLMKTVKKGVFSVICRKYYNERERRSEILKIVGVVSHYSYKLNLSKYTILKAFETNRNYSARSYYPNVPKLNKNTKIFKTFNDVKNSNIKLECNCGLQFNQYGNCRCGRYAHYDFLLRKYNIIIKEQFINNKI